MLPLSVPFRNYWTLVNLKFLQTCTSGSIFTAKSTSNGQKSAKKLNYTYFAYNSMQMSKI